MAITQAMKGFLSGSAVAVALAAFGSDASAGLTDEAPLPRAAAVGTVHGTRLAKAKKRRRPAPSAGKAAAPADDADADDAPSKSSPAESGSSDEAKEEELFGSSSAKKKKLAAASDDGDAPDGGGGGGGGSASASARARPRPKMAEESVESKASEESDEGGASVGSALEFGVGGKALFRNLAWTGNGSAAGLGPYSLTPGPETGAWLEFYPAAFGTSGFAANVGLFGRFDYGFGVATTLQNQDVVKTTFRDFLAGLKVRIPMGSFVPNVSVAYGLQLFAIDPQNTPADIPQVAYQFVRPALGGRAFFTPGVWADFSLGYLMVLNPGSGTNYVRGSDFFPRATAYGVDVGASIAMRLMGSIGLRGGIDFRRYAISLNPDASTRAVTGAVDQYIVAWGGVEVVLDGQGGSSSDDEPKPAKRKRRRAPEPKDDESEEDSEKSEDE
jgi:hypothetical protein